MREEKSRSRDDEAEERCVGLGQGVGGTLARSCLGVAESREEKKEATALPTAIERDLSDFKSCEGPKGLTGAMLSYSEPKGMWFSLLMNDMGPVPQEDLDKVTSHRWSFQGALELAAPETQT